jgi:hypothetical protein
MTIKLKSGREIDDDVIGISTDGLFQISTGDERPFVKAFSRVEGGGQMYGDLTKEEMLDLAEYMRARWCEVRDLAAAGYFSEIIY